MWSVAVAVAVAVAVLMTAVPAAEATGCHSDSDCLGMADWRCAQAPRGQQGLSCHIPGPGTAGNKTCACEQPRCGLGPYAKPKNPSWKQYLMIGDSISLGQESLVFAALNKLEIEADHNPGNAGNSNLGVHCFANWTLASSRTWDLISFNFGLHDIAYDTERISVEEYTNLLGGIIDKLAAVQQAHGTKLLWVTTTPVPTVPNYGPGCTDTTKCLNPPRYDADVRLYNAAAAKLVADSKATIETLDLYTFVLNKCGGQGYSHCDGFQLPFNVHYTPAGWQALANQTVAAVTSLLK